MAVWPTLLARSRGVPGLAPPMTSAPAGTTTMAVSSRAGNAATSARPAAPKTPP